jgi:indole-3-glycerol phosphate synthase/phosphoribosylanthranilate isomerase
VLAQVAAAKRTELDSRYQGVALDGLRQRARPTARSLADALAAHGARFILEIKKASPSAGSIRLGADAGVLARGYAGVADALSVLADAQYFGGSLDDVAAARRAFDGPILAKDFFLDLRQVAEARIAGADAILVMLSLLGDEQARAMIAEARSFGMDALVEVHDEREMRRALGLGALLIGINNRDLRDFSIDLSTTERLARLAPDCVLVSESGIVSRGDVDRLAPKVDAFLVGSSLMRAKDPAEAARSLVFGRVKLCGVKRREDIAASAAATYHGFNFVAGSPRQIGLAQALRLVPLAHRAVGVFRNMPVPEIAHCATLLGLAAAQLHGDESAAEARALVRRLPDGCELWKAISVSGDAPLAFAVADRLLFDNGVGGTGKAFDWSLVRGHPDLPSALVAGGIGAGNARAAQQLGAYAIDVGSAVDERPGFKSPDKIAALFDALRPAARERLRACA